MAGILFSCVNDLDTIQKVSDNPNAPDDVMKDLSVFYTDSGYARVQINAGYAETYYYDGMWGSQETDLEPALKAARKAVELSGDDASAHLALGRVYRLLRNYEAEKTEYSNKLNQKTSTI